MFCDDWGVGSKTVGLPSTCVNSTSVPVICAAAAPCANPTLVPVLYVCVPAVPCANSTLVPVLPYCANSTLVPVLCATAMPLVTGLVWPAPRIRG